MSNKHDYPPMKLGPPPHKQILFLGAMVMAWVLVALFVCLITHNWTWEMFGRAIAIQMGICYVVGEIYSAFRCHLGDPGARCEKLKAG